MKLLFDKSDLPHAVKLRDERFKWLEELNATELADASLDAAGFLFDYAHGEEHYRSLVEARPNVRDRPAEQQELLYLDGILQRLQNASIDVPTPRTWLLGVDDAVPSDLEFPVFVRTRKSSWKRGGKQSHANNLKGLQDEIELLRRAFGWDAPIIVRQWINVAVAGKWMYGDAPQEVRVWIVDHVPAARSFHYMHAVPSPRGFPPRDGSLECLRECAAKIGPAFTSRLIAADFIRDRQGKWWFLEAGLGAVASTAHEAVSNMSRKGFEGACRNWNPTTWAGPYD